MKFSYSELKAWLGNLTDDQLSMDVTIMLMDTNELVPAHSIGIPSDDDRLDEGHPVIFV